MSSRSGHHPPINGLEIYFEVYRTLDAAAAPLLVIPGAFMSTDSMQAWTRDRVDQQGHGRTPRAMSYRQFGGDAGRTAARA